MRATAAALIIGRSGPVGAAGPTPAIAKKSVAVAPGHSVVTVTPVPRNSQAIASPRLST